MAAPATRRCTSWARFCGTARPSRSSSYLPKIASGELRLQAFGVTEPTSGTDTLSLRTTAKREGNDHYVINGQKIWTSRAEHSDLMLLLARTTPLEKVKKRTDGLSVFLVDMRLAQGTSINISPIRTMMNHATTQIFFDDLRVPAENLIGEEGQGFRYILSGMNAERILIAAECIGDCKWFIKKATGYAKERELFGRPIGQNQGVQFPIARAYAQMRAAELMVHEAARKYEAGADIGPEANMAKLLGGRRLVVCRRHVRADPRRLRLCRGIRRRAKIPRDAALSGGADLDQYDPVAIWPSTCSACRGRIDWLPLEGLLVVSVEQAVAAPQCTCRLADAGARVIKVERPEGDFARGYDYIVHGESAHFVWLNRGKQSVVLDLTKDGRQEPCSKPCSPRPTCSCRI